MPNIRIFIRAVSSSGELTQERPVRLQSRRRARAAIREVARAAIREVARYIDQAQPGWMRGFNAATILPAKRSCAYRLREYYALTGLSPRLERHYNVALGI